MRSLISSLFLIAVPLCAANEIWFDPPNPTNRTAVMVHVRAQAAYAPKHADVTVSAREITVTLTELERPSASNIFSFAADLGLLPAGIYHVTVGFPNVIPFVGEATLTVQDGAPPFEVQPNIGGGTTVRIVGDVTTCLDGPSPIVCNAGVVKFGGQVAEIVRVSPGVIEVVPPNGDFRAPPVDVTIESAEGTLRSVAAFLYWIPGGPPDLTFFEPVLFPVIGKGPAAFGSFWQTEVVVSNGNDYELPFQTEFDPICFFPGCPLGAHRTLWTVEAKIPNGYLLYFPRQTMRKMHFHALVRDLSRDAEDLGTEIPMVLEKDFYDRPFTLLDVPTDPRYRVALRLYRIDGGSDLLIRISQISFDEQPSLAEAVIPLSPQPPTPSYFSYSMGYIGDLVGMYPQLAGKGPLRIEVVGAEKRAAWGFVSVTNNQTQHVTVISPQ